MVRKRAMKEIGVGLIGCGNISTIYLTNLPLSPGVTVRACSDMRPEIAEAQGKKFGVETMTVDTLLARGDIDIVVNLTVPAAHAAVSLAALSAGKHVFSEKPLAVDIALARTIIEEAEARGLMVGCAPDTFLGAGGRLARRLIDEGAIGRVLSGTAFVMSHGMEHWHPDPEFFFKPGGGPVLDVGPYHITALINLLGPVGRVMALTGAGFAERIVTAEGARKGHRIAVETPTTALSLLEFRCGAQVMFGASWDVWRHSLPAIELYGTEGSMRVPDPNFFGGVVEITKKGGAWTEHDSTAMPLGRPNWPDEEPRLANYRALGVADMAAALRSGGKNHASGRLALHALEVMAAILEAGRTGTALTISREIERPPVLSEKNAERLFRL
jgi:predicted dehydrogenase